MGSVLQDKVSLIMSLPVVLVLTAAAGMLGCGGGSASSPVLAPPVPALQSVSITVSPATASVVLGNAQTFAATVTNTADTAVSWNVNGVPGGNPSTGTISATGVYTAPADLPSSVTAQITATSHADSSKSASA